MEINLENTKRVCTFAPRFGSVERKGVKNGTSVTIGVKI